MVRLRIPIAGTWKFVDNKMRLACLYLPNGNPAPGIKFDYILKWFRRAAYVLRPLSRAKIIQPAKRVEHATGMNCQVYPPCLYDVFKKFHFRSI
jgi:hypothetical protein